MDVVVTLGKISGVVGICLGIFLIIFRDVIRKKIFPRLPAREAYQLLRLALILTWTIAVLGLIIWAAPEVMAIGNNIVIYSEIGESSPSTSPALETSND